MKNLPKQYQVNVIIDGRVYSNLCNIKGKTRVCLSTARKWAKQYENTFMHSEYFSGRDLLLKITLA